jgi:hypothetical protein
VETRGPVHGQIEASQIVRARDLDRPEPGEMGRDELGVEQPEPSGAQPRNQRD